MKIQINSVDWNKSDSEIARQFNCVPSAVNKQRHRLGIKPAENYPRRKLKHLKTEAQLAERKTVHGWLDLKGIPKEEFGKPICLLRRLAIALEIHSPTADNSMGLADALLSTKPLMIETRHFYKKIQWERDITAVADFCQTQSPQFNRPQWLSYLADGKCGLGRA